MRLDGYEFKAFFHPREPFVENTDWEVCLLTGRGERIVFEKGFTLTRALAYEAVRKVLLSLRADLENIDWQLEMRLDKTLYDGCAY